VTEKIEQHKDIIDANNKSFYEMKKAKDAKQNERKYVGGLNLVFCGCYSVQLHGLLSKRTYS